MPAHLPRKLLLACTSLAVALLLLEALLHASPRLLPRLWMAEFPYWGVEFEQPGVLSRTPLGEVPLPAPGRTYVGPPPADIGKLFGMFARESNPDLTGGERVRLPVDAMGFPNERIPERADIVIVGDSFAFMTGLRQPPGLAVELERRSGRSVYVASCPAIAPQQAGFLLRDQALPLRPRVVVWIFFGGNDVQDAGNIAILRQRGARTVADEPGYRPVPRSRLLGLLRWSLGGSPVPRPPLQPLEGVRLAGAVAPGPPLWFCPLYLQLLAVGPADWQAHPGFGASVAALAEGDGRCREAGARLVVLYVPSKGQALLPFLAHDQDALAAMAFHGAPQPPPLTAEAYFELASRHLDGIETLLAGACAERGIAFLSATPALRALAAQGRAGYYCGDTHWNPEGQLAALEPLLEWVLEHYPRL